MKFKIIIKGACFLSILAGMIAFSTSCSDREIQADKVYTTLDRTIVPVAVPAIPTVKIDDPANFEKFGYGLWNYGPGVPYQKRLELMPADYSTGSVTNKAKLLRFFAITDVHQTDEESPVQAIYYARILPSFGSSIYSPLMLYTTQMLDATVQTINKLHKQDPLDFGIALGDISNSMQYNELRWFIDNLDGKTINPDSGKKDDPIPGAGNDYQDEFKAAGLDASIPWYVTIGNHDHFFIGAMPVTERVRNAFVGDEILKLGNAFISLSEMDKTTYSMGSLDGSTPYGTIIGCGVVAQMEAQGIAIPKVTPDPDRRALLVNEWISEFSNTTSLPKGHGFIQNDPKNVFGASYSFEPKSDLPIKVIVMDDTMNKDDVTPNFYGYGSLSNGRWEWLMEQLQAGQAEGKLMIVAAHVPLACENVGVGWRNAAEEKKLISELQNYPNLLMWIAGHAHRNKVTPLPSADPAKPENGFWVVETKSLHDFPQQFRTFDIVRNSDNSISIFTLNIDPEFKEGSLAAIARHYSIASTQIYGIIDPLLPSGSVAYNAELMKTLTAEMQAKIANYGTPIIK